MLAFYKQIIRKNWQNPDFLRGHQNGLIMLNFNRTAYTLLYHRFLVEENFGEFNVRNFGG